MKRGQLRRSANPARDVFRRARKLDLIDAAERSRMAAELLEECVTASDFESALRRNTSAALRKEYCARADWIMFWPEDRGPYDSCPSAPLVTASRLDTWLEEQRAK